LREVDVGGRMSIDSTPQGGTHPRQDLTTLFDTRHTARGWSDQPVPDELIREVYDAVRWGPTAMNATPLRLMMIRSEQARQRLAQHMAERNVEVVLNAPLNILVAADADFHRHLPTLAPHAPGLADRFTDPTSRKTFAREQTWLQAGYLTVALRAAGLDVGPMSGMDAAAIDADLLADTGWHAMMVLNVGYPIAEPTSRQRAPRLSFEDAALVV
jgi:3-hydroxypropanoate dehydrogenase